MSNVTHGGNKTNAGNTISTYEKAGAPVDGVDEVQRLTSTVGSGSFAITFVNPLSGISKTTAAIAWNATNAVIQAALRLLTNMPAAAVVASGGPTINAGAVDLTFVADLAGINVAQVTIDNTLAVGGTVVPSTVTPGVSGTERGAPKGSLLSDTTNALLYQNSGTAQKPAWTKVGTQS